MKKIRLDGETVEHEVPDAVAARFDSMQSELKTLATAKADGEAKLSAANAALETVKADAAAAAAALPTKIQEGVAARLALVARADGFGIAVKHEDSDDSIKRAVIVGAMPSVKADSLEGLSLDAHLDAACSLLEAREDGASNSQRRSVSDGVPSQNQAHKADSAEAKFADAWKTKP